MDHAVAAQDVGGHHRDAVDEDATVGGLMEKVENLLDVKAAIEAEGEKPIT